VAARRWGGDGGARDSLTYAQQRESFGQPIWKLSLRNYWPTWQPNSPPHASSPLRRQRYDSGERCDMEAGWPKLFASEVAMEIALNACGSTAATGTPPNTRGTLLSRRTADDCRRGTNEISET